MKETLFLIIFVIIFFIFLASRDRTLVKFENNNYTIWVREAPDMKESAELLMELVVRMYKLRDWLVEHKKDFPEYEQYIDFMAKNFNKKRTIIYETSFNSQYTSYAVNKGEELVFCLRCKKDYSLHPINLLMYVAVHEMGHTACPETGHTPLFHNIFRFLLEQAVKLNLYYYEDYSMNPVEYCGMKLYTNILN